MQITFLAGSILARVNVNFIGLWRHFLGVRSIMVDVATVDEAKEYVELNYGPIYWNWLRSRGIHHMQSVWENSNVLLNGRRLTESVRQALDDGDTLDLVPRVAGG